ncbi:MAG: thioredoxin family protein [Bacilli bacterium]|nr:thioredoxin family protein [Bacilli bacterium]
MKYVMISAIWCPACIITNTAMDKVVEEKHITVEKLDYDFDDISKYNVGKILPEIIVYKDDKEIGRIIGEKNYKDLCMEIDKYEKVD